MAKLPNTNNPNPSAFSDFKKQQQSELYKQWLARQGELEDTAAREKHLTRLYERKVQESLWQVNQPELASKIERCYRNPNNSNKRYQTTCRSPWCLGCRNFLYQQHFQKVVNRIQHGKHTVVEYQEQNPLLLTDTKQRLELSEYSNNDLRHITGIVGICHVDSKQLRDLLRGDDKRWRRIKRRLNKITKEVYWIECAYELELVAFDKLKANTDIKSRKRIQMTQLIEYEKHWNNDSLYSRNPFLFVHWHGITNLPMDELRQVFADEYWLNMDTWGERYNEKKQRNEKYLIKNRVRIDKTEKHTGLYIQKLKKNQTLEHNIRKITSYPFKNPTRFKHTFIGSDYSNGEFFTPWELGGLIAVYSKFIGRQARGVFRSIGNDAEVWFEVNQNLLRLAQSGKLRKKSLKEFSFILQKLLLKTKRRGGGNIANELTPFITDKYTRKRIIQDVKRDRGKWKFHPVALMQWEKDWIAKLEQYGGSVFGGIDQYGNAVYGKGLIPGVSRKFDEQEWAEDSVKLLNLDKTKIETPPLPIDSVNEV